MVEIEEKEKIVIAKPVACRPRFSNPKSFSDLLCVASNASPSAAFTETAVAVIRPTTVRFKPAEAQGSAACNPSKPDLLSNTACNVIYKPVAKLVSRTTVSLLSNLGANVIAPSQEVSEVGDRAQSSNQVTHQTDATLEVHHDFPTQSEQRANATADETKSSFPANTRDRLSYDGHNWRKYGQKQVKGSEYPRSYFKCTYPKCPVKKKVEKTLDGQIAEIVYKGEHNHLKPLPSNRTPSDGHAQTPSHEVQSHFINQQTEMVRAHESRSENQDVTESSNQSTFSGTPPVRNPVTSAACSAGPSTSNHSLGRSGECEEVIEFIEAEGGDFRSKKRTKSENQLLRARTVGVSNSDPQLVVQNNTASGGIVGDGFRWRKYGQKVVKGKKFPRSYYRCTNPDCNVRKYVERTFEDPGTFITTYEGKHNHPMPTRSINAEASKTSRKN